jgi:HAD superfamily phosphoserine phosphatase-like hydrolase
MKIVAVFDMDRTLTRRGTWAGWLRFWLRHEAPWRVLLLPLLLGPLLAYRAGRLGRGELKAAVQAVVMGGRVQGRRVRAAAARYAAHVVADELFEGARDALAAARRDGAVVVIATASNAYYAEAIGAALGVDHVISTRMAWEDSGEASGEGDWLVARLASPNCYGEAKAGMVRDWLATEGLGGGAGGCLVGPCVRPAAPGTGGGARRAGGGGQCVGGAAGGGRGAGLAGGGLGGGQGVVAGAGLRGGDSASARQTRQAQSSRK